MFGLPLRIPENDFCLGPGQAISGAEKGEQAALLLSPRCSAPTGANDSCRQSNGTLFTMFLTSPLQAFCILVGISSSEVDMVRLSSLCHSCLRILLRLNHYPRA